MLNDSQVDAEFVNFLAGKVKDVKSPMFLHELCKEFKMKSGTCSTRDVLLSRLKRIRDKMSEMEHIDTETKMKIIFALGAPVSNGFLIELKKQADVELDERHRIIKYKKNGEGLQLSGVHITSCRSADIGTEKRMMKFLVEKSENATSPITDMNFLKEFNSSEGNLKKDHSFFTRYMLLKQQIYLTPEFDPETKIKMMFMSNTKVHANILEELQKTAVVEVDEHHRITKYESNNGSLKLNGEHTTLPSLPPTEWSKEEKDKFLSFLTEKSKQTKKPLIIGHLCSEFAEKNGVFRTKDSVNHYVRKVLPKISKLGNLNLETRMKMLFALSVPVDEEFLNELRKNAFVEIDEKERITKYEANDGSLRLYGDHSISAKIKAGQARKERMSGFSASEVDEKSEDGENEEDEEEDVKEDVLRLETTNRKLSKKRYPENDISYDFDNGSLDSPKNVKNVTEELVASSSNSFPKAPLVKNQKRKIVENPSDSTISSSKSRKYGRLADIQKDIESEKSSSRTNKNDGEEVIYDGTVEPLSPVELPIKQEPLSYEAVKLEDEEHKPDLSFLCNTTQDNMHNFTETKENHTNNAEQSSMIAAQISVDSVDSTSSIKFLKLIRNVIRALESPILVAFQEKIELKISELRGNDVKVPIKSVLHALESAVHLVQNRASTTILTANSTSFKEFLSIFRTATFNLTFPGLADFQKKLKELGNHIENQNKRISFEKVRHGLEYAIEFVIA